MDVDDSRYMEELSVDVNIDKLEETLADRINDTRQSLN